MKILAAGDIHSDQNLARQLAEKASSAGVDLVILCGDLTLADKTHENILGEFKKRNLKVMFVPGNHETLATADFLARLYKVINLHGRYYIIYDLAFIGCGGANTGLFTISDDEIFYLLKYNNDKIKNARKRIFVTHVHPEGTLMERFSNFVKGSKGLRKAIQVLKPDLVLCSHVHEASGIEEMLEGSKIINVGKEGKIIEL